MEIDLHQLTRNLELTAKTCQKIAEKGENKEEGLGELPTLPQEISQAFEELRRLRQFKAADICHLVKEADSTTKTKVNEAIDHFLLASKTVQEKAGKIAGLFHFIPMLDIEGILEQVKEELERSAKKVERKENGEI
ncbi:MAG: hypothetical protein WB791_00195 [Waddliaceae bacterium]